MSKILISLLFVLFVGNNIKPCEKKECKKNKLLNNMQIQIQRLKKNSEKNNGPYPEETRELIDSLENKEDIDLDRLNHSKDSLKDNDDQAENYDEELKKLVTLSCSVQ